MLTQIDVVFGESGGEALALPILGVTPSESLLIREVTGLNPPPVDLFIGDYARDGGFYGGRRVGNRNVVFTIDLNPNPALGESVQGLRELLYKTFIDPQVDADFVEFVLHDEAGNTRNLYGYTETFETELFGIDTVAQISVICPDPYIRDVAETALFNTSGTWLTVPFTYNGTAETGFEVEIHMSATTPEMTLRNNFKDLTLVHPFTSDDVIYINTNRGYRDIRRASATNVNGLRALYGDMTLSQLWGTLIADGDTTSMLSKLTTSSKWLELHSQANTMSVFGEGLLDVVGGVKALSYRSSYWGV